jgi:Mn2+/Fe2+ NRAMP family transporter
MIQRIQSIFLAICSLGFGSHFFTNLAVSSESIPVLMADKVYEIQDHILLIILTVLGIIISFGAIFLFNNRLLQQKLSIFTIILSILVPIAAFILIYTEKTNEGNLQSIDDSLGLYLCLIPVIFGLLAYKSIGKDEKLVRSMDRLR